MDAYFTGAMPFRSTVDCCQVKPPGKFTVTMEAIAGEKAKGVSGTRSLHTESESERDSWGSFKVTWRSLYLLVDNA